MKDRLLSLRDVEYLVAEAGHGPALLLLHGFTGSHQSFAPFLSNWSKRWHVIVPDLLGHGQTSAPIEEERYSWENTLLDLFSILDRLGIERFLCLGYSMGGRLALGLASSQPERVQALILESSSPGLKVAQERAQRIEQDRQLAERIEAYGIKKFVSEWEKIPLFASQQKLPLSIQETQRAIRLAQREMGLAGSLRGIGTGAQPSLWTELHRLTMPTLLLTGEWDEKFQAIADRMMGHIPNVKHRIILQAGHTTHLEQPELYSQEVIHFIEGVLH